jgi:hypothetical protein
MTEGDIVWMCEGLKDFPEQLDAMVVQCPGEGNAEKIKLARTMCVNFKPVDGDKKPVDGDKKPAGPSTEFLCQNFDGCEALTRICLFV